MEHLLRAIMDISAHAISLGDRPQRTIRATIIRTRREDRSSISSHSLADLGGQRCWLRHRQLVSEHSFVRAFLPFLRPGLRTQTRRALGAVKAGRHASLASRSFAARPRLDWPEHGARIKLVGASSICPDALEGATLIEYCPGNAGELVGERNRQHVVVKALSCGLDP